eukprot:3779993-Amphidinium_carterae.1
MQMRLQRKQQHQGNYALLEGERRSMHMSSSLGKTRTVPFTLLVGAIVERRKDSAERAAPEKGTTHAEVTGVRRKAEECHKAHK